MTASCGTSNPIDYSRSRAPITLHPPGSLLGPPIRVKRMIPFLLLLLAICTSTTPILPGSLIPDHEA
jgi:hypothetical protein